MRTYDSTGGHFKDDAIAIGLWMSMYVCPIKSWTYKGFPYTESGPEQCVIANQDWY
jgi:hypothetical protein